MKDAELKTCEQDALSIVVRSTRLIEQETGRPFFEVCTDRLADHVRRNPCDVPRLRRLAERQSAPTKMSGDTYVTEALEQRDANEDRWLAAKAKIGNPEVDQSTARVEELIAHAQWCADAHTLGQINPLKAHLREQRIDALALFFAWLSELQGKREVAKGSRRKADRGGAPA
jgi:hypothetical protein